MVDKHLTIQVLSDDVLLHIFSYFRPHQHRPYFFYGHIPPLTWAWQRLANVCRRWRYLIFVSPRSLGVWLVISSKRCGTTLDLWPPLPISIHSGAHQTLSSKEEQNVISTLRHSDRIFDIDLSISDSLLKKSNLWMKSFSALGRLCLTSPYHQSTVLPREFLGGPTITSRRLRYITFKGVSLPTLPQLLLSSCDLIRLHLGKNVLTGDGFLSPARLATALCTAARLEFLHVHLPSKVFHKDQGSADPMISPPDLVVLPALNYFDLKGSNKYLEDFVSRIHAPALKSIRVDISNKNAERLEFSQLSQFVSRAERMSLLPLQTFIYLKKSGLRISHEFGIRGHLCFELRRDSGPGYFQVSQAVHICRKLSPLMISDAKRVCVDLNIETRNSPDETDVRVSLLWLQLFSLFNGTQELEWYSEYLPEAHDSITIGQELLPALRVLRLDIGPRTPRFIKSFVAERKLTCRPITVMCMCRPFESSSESA